jgi:hypothetical protein
VVKLAKNEMLAEVKIRNRKAVRNAVALQPQTVKLVYYFLPSDSVINTADFAVEADLAQVNPKDSTALVQVIQKPAAVKMVSVHPQKVKLIF